MSVIEHPIKIIEVEPDGELARLLDEADGGEIQLVRDGVRYRLARERDDIWAGYDLEKSLAGIRKAAGSWKGLIDAEEFKAYIRERRRTKNRPSVRW